METADWKLKFKSALIRVHPCSSAAKKVLRFFLPTGNPILDGIAVIAAILLLSSVQYPALAAAADINIEGRVFTESGPLKGAKVYAYRNYEDIQRSRPFSVSKPSDKKGLYKVRLPEGEYYFVAKGNEDGKEYFAYHGRNPIKLAQDRVWIAFVANELKSPPAYTPGSPAIKGIATYKGRAVEGAYVALYAPESKVFRGLGLRTESVDNDGTFNLSVAPGSYVVIAKKTETGTGNKPLKKGDLFCYYPYNPVEVKPDKTIRIEVPCYPKDDRSVFVAAPSIKPADYATLETIASSFKTGIKGKVTDAGGKPVAGMIVLAYKTESPVFMMYHLSHGTEHTAETDKNGDYFIPLDQSGDYTLVARDILGNGPHRGEIYGLYQGNQRHVVSFKAGELRENVNVSVGKIMAEPLKDIQQQDSPVKQDAVSNKPPSPGPAAMAAQVIDRDTTWQGNILLKGVISIKRGATLTINPGTVVRFSRIDQDENGVGDGELLVEGRLIARGTRDKRIVFTSAAEKPQPADWSYVQFLGAEADSVLEYCRFEWAYAGVMVHYSNVKITDCVFADNNRGLHFNTANLVVDHNTFVNNKIGIRFMRFEGKITVSNNTIERNDIGVLFVRQHVNAVDFGKPEKGREQPKFFNNNICSNNKYNISLGEGQNQDIDVANNWWCESEQKKIAKTIYDNEKDDELSSVIFSPFLPAAVQGAGVRE